MINQVSTRKTARWNILFLVLIILEALFPFYFNHDVFPITVTATGLFIISLLIGILVLVRYFGTEVNAPPVNPQVVKRQLPVFLYLGLLIGLVLQEVGFSLGSLEDKLASAVMV